MPEITPNLTEELSRLFEGHPVRRMSRGLRYLFMEYLVTNAEMTHYNELTSWFADLTYDLGALMEFLDVAEEEYKS